MRVRRRETRRSPVALQKLRCRLCVPANRTELLDELGAERLSIERSKLGILHVERIDACVDQGVVALDQCRSHIHLDGNEVGQEDAGSPRFVDQGVAGEKAEAFGFRTILIRRRAPSKDLGRAMLAQPANLGLGLFGDVLKAAREDIGRNRGLSPALVFDKSTRRLAAALTHPNGDQKTEEGAERLNPGVGSGQARDCLGYLLKTFHRVPPVSQAQHIEEWA